MERSKSGEFNWIDLSARNFEGQSAFYEGLFGWTHTDMPFGEGMVYRMFAADGHTVAGMSQLAPDMIANGQPSAWNTYLATDDVDATTARAVELGRDGGHAADGCHGDGSHGGHPGPHRRLLLPVEVRSPSTRRWSTCCPGRSPGAT